MKNKIALLLMFCSLVAFAETKTDTIQKTSILQKVECWYGENMNYLSITALMTIESSFIPFLSLNQSKFITQ